MIRVFPFIFVILWSSAFITTKPLIDNSDPFSALAFRFSIVTIGFLLFSLYFKKKILIKKKEFIESFLSGVLFHGLYLGGVFYSISIGMPTGIAALIVTLQPVLTNALSGPILNEKITIKQWIGVLLGFSGAAIVLFWCSYSAWVRYWFKYSSKWFDCNHNSFNCNYIFNYLAKKN